MREDDLPGLVGEVVRHGRISSVDLPAGRIVVDLGEVQTGPVRWFTGGAGGTKVWSRPKVGEQVTLLCPDGDIEGAIALRGHTCDAFPHIGDEEREVVQFEDGATLAYNPSSHALEIVLPGGATASIIAPGGVTIQADVSIQGDLAIDGEVTASGDVVGQGISLHDHTHPGVYPGGSNTGTPQ